MQQRMLPYLRCPVTRSPLSLAQVQTSESRHEHAGDGNVVIREAILYAAQDWFFPVIDGIPRLTVEAFADYHDFFTKHLPDYVTRRQQLESKYAGLIAYVKKKNKRTRESFSREWGFYNYQEDRTWDAGKEEMLQCFLQETGESTGSLRGKTVLDAGCGNGHLDMLIAQQGAIVLAMDLSRSIERAYRQNKHPDAWYIQGDVQFPPVAFSLFDIVHSSGVLHHTNNTELSFGCLAPCVKPGGKLSVWLYHPRRDLLHRFFNVARVFISPLPSGLQYFLLSITIFPVSYLIKKIKGNRQNHREMMIDILDWFTPEFRREHLPDEVACWFLKREFVAVQVTTTGAFGFNMMGKKPALAERPISRPE